MGLFRLLIGKHIGPDHAKKPVPVLDLQGNKVGEKHPSRTYTAGETIDSDLDLVAFGGVQKFLKIGESARAVPGEAPVSAGVAAPGGQVSEGFQHTFTAPDGRSVSGPLSAEDAKAIREKHADRLPEAAPEAAPVPAHAPGKVPAKPSTLSPRVRYTEAELQQLTVQDLKEVAADEEVDLKGATRKEDIVRTILQAK